MSEMRTKEICQHWHAYLHGATKHRTICFNTLDLKLSCMYSILEMTRNGLQRKVLFTSWVERTNNAGSYSSNLSGCSLQFQPQMQAARSDTGSLSLYQTVR